MPLALAKQHCSNTNEAHSAAGGGGEGGGGLGSGGGGEGGGGEGGGGEGGGGEGNGGEGGVDGGAGGRSGNGSTTFTQFSPSLLPVPAEAATRWSLSMSPLVMPHW